MPPTWNPNQEFRFLVPSGYRTLPPNGEGYIRIEWLLIDHDQQGVPAEPNPVHLTQNGKVSASVQWPHEAGFTARDSIGLWVLDVSLDKAGSPPSFLDDTDDAHWRDGLDLVGISQTPWPGRDPEYWIIYCAQSRNINVAAADGVWTLTLKLQVNVDGHEYNFICDPRMCVGGGCD